MLRNPYHYPAVPARRPNLNVVAEEGCSHVATCNAFTASTSTPTTTNSSSPLSLSPSSSPPATTANSSIGIGRATTNLCANNTGSACRACTVCGATKTPLWRSGPQGPKSLCNACGIRARKMHERQYHFPRPQPQTLVQQSPPTRLGPTRGLREVSPDSKAWNNPSDTTDNGLKYERRVWNLDVKIHGHPQTNLRYGEFHHIGHVEEDEEDEDEDAHSEINASDSCLSSTSSIPSQVWNKHSGPLCPPIKHLLFKRKAPRSPTPISQRPIQPRPLLSSFCFSKDDEQAALLLMALSHGLALISK